MGINRLLNIFKGSNLCWVAKIRNIPDNHWIPLGTAFGKVISPSVAVFNGGMQFDSMNSRENLENVGSALVSHEFTDSRGVNDYSMGRFSFSLISQYGATTNRLKVLFC